MKHLSIDFSRVIGPVKQMNGINCGPLTRNFHDDARPWFKEARIPFSHLHDCENPYGSGEFVDVDSIFKVFKCDPDDPECYNFRLTDEYLKAITECGTGILYRLGCAIDFQYHIHTVPPKDYLKWAKIVEHIILHYNYGWADGLHLNIRDWEIWSEPDTKNIWYGEWEEFFAFYKVAVTYLKNRFPDLHFGGSDIANIEGGFLRSFLEYMTKDGSHVPYDFCTYQCYMKEPDDCVKRAEYARDILHEFGYDDTEIVCSEWNYVRNWQNMPESFGLIKKEHGAAFCAALMCAMQNSPANRAAYYVAHPKSSWCGLFSKGTSMVNGGGAIAEREKPYYAFKAYGDIAAQKDRVEASIEEGNVYVLAAAGEKKTVMLANYKEEGAVLEKIRLNFSDPETVFEVFRTDKRNTEACIGRVKSGDVLSMPKDSIVLLKEI